MDTTLYVKTLCYLVSFDRVAIVLRSIMYMKKSPFLKDVKNVEGMLKMWRGKQFKRKARTTLSPQLRG